MELIAAGTNGWFHTGWQRPCPGKSAAGAAAAYSVGFWPRKGEVAGELAEPCSQQQPEPVGLKQRCGRKRRSLKLLGAQGLAGLLALEIPKMQLTPCLDLILFAYRNAAYVLQWDAASVREEQAAAAPRSETPQSRGCCPGRGDPWHFAGLEHPCSIPFALAIPDFITGLRK